MPSTTNALPPAEPTPALAELAEVFGGAHASPPQRPTTARFRCVKPAGALGVMKPRARRAPELSDRCVRDLRTRAASSFWHACVQEALALIAATTTARPLGASVPRRPAGANRATWTRCATSKLRALSPPQSRCGGECRRSGKSRPGMRSWLRARRGHASSSGRTARQKSSCRWLQYTVRRLFVVTKLGASWVPLPAERARLVQRRRRPLRSCWRGISKLRTSASTPRTPCKCAAYAVAPDPTRSPSRFVCCRKRSSPSHGSSESSLIRRSAALRRMKRATRRRSRRRKRPC